MEGLDPCLIKGLRKIFTQHSVVQALNTAHQNQRKIRQEMLQVDQQDEDNLVSAQ